MKQMMIGVCATIMLFVIAAGILDRKHETQGVESLRGEGVLGDDFLRSSATVLDVVMARLDGLATSINNDPEPLLGGIAGRLLTTRYGMPPTVYVDIGITEEGRVRLVGTTGGLRVAPDQFRDTQVPSEAACAFLLKSLTDEFLGWARMTVHGEFIPEVSYARYMGAVRRNEPAFRKAARALWLHTEATFYLQEEEMDRQTECHVTAGPDGWIGDTP